MFNMEDPKTEEQNSKENAANQSTTNDIGEEKKVEDNNEVDSEEKLGVDSEKDNSVEENNSEEDAVNLLEELINSLKEENKKLSEENSKIKNENDIIKDRLARTSAEYENYRKRTAKEKEGIYTDACEDVLSQMLPVLDNLERAANVEGSIEDLKKGIEMTVRQFNSALEKLNVEEISTECEFDPHIHNAVMHVEEGQFGKNQIVEVFQKGYKRGDKVLRYSMVKVAN